MSFFYDDSSNHTGRAGHIHDSGAFHDRVRRKVGNGAQEVRTIVVDNSANSTAYAWTLQGTAQTITSAASATKILIAAQIQNKINGSSLFGTLYAESNGVDTVTVTYRTRGTAFTLSDADANLTCALVTAASSGSSLPPGIIAMEDPLSTGQNGAVTVPSSTTAVAKIVDLTPEYSAGDEWTVSVLVLGVPYVGIVTMATDLATSLDAMVEALNEALPASTVLVEDGTTKMTLTSEVAGQDFTVSSTVSDIGGVSTPVTNTVVAANVTAAFSGTIVGPVLLEQVGELPASGLYEYIAGDVINCGRTGRYDVLLDTGETVAAGDSVYVRTTASASEQLGACRNDTDSGDAVLWSRASFISANFTGLDGQNCATVQVDA